MKNTKTSGKHGRKLHHRYEVGVDLTELAGSKYFNHIAGAVRGVSVEEGGVPSMTGLTNGQFRRKEQIIEFPNSAKARKFRKAIQQLFAPNILGKMIIRHI